MRLTANRSAGLLRKEGDRLTPQRHAVLESLECSHVSLTPDAIHEGARACHPGVARVTVYRTLALLGRYGLACRVYAPDGGPSHAMARPGGHHHHLVCSQCGRIEDCTDCDLKTLEERLARETGFRLRGHLLELYGTFPECQQRGK